MYILLSSLYDDHGAVWPPAIAMKRSLAGRLFVGISGVQLITFQSSMKPGTVLLSSMNCSKFLNMFVVVFSGVLSVTS